MNKYRNTPTTVDGIRFASKHEAQRWQELRLMERAGEICDLQRQVPFDLIPALRKPDGTMQLKARYIADFVYYDNRKRQKIVEDAKGYPSKEYQLKKKLVYWIHGYYIQEV